MICVASWFDSTDPANRRRSLELWMSSDTGTRGTLYQTTRDEPGDVWPPAEKIGSGYGRTAAARIARQLGLVSLTEYPDTPARAPLGGSEPADEPRVVGYRVNPYREVTAESGSELVAAHERALLLELVVNADAEAPLGARPAMRQLIAEGWRFGIGTSIGSDSALGTALERLEDADLIQVDRRLGAYRARPGQLERVRAELEARS